MQHSMSSDDITTDSADGVPRSVGRVLDLLEIVLAAGSCNLTEAAAAADLTPTTARRHLTALEARGYLQRDDLGLFSAGPTVRRLAATVHEGGPVERLMVAAQPHLDDLAVATGESCYLAIAERGTATYVATAESSRPLRHVGWVGQTVPLDGTAVGAALSQPGLVVARSGSIEPDVSAVSLALAPYGLVRAAISVIGPAHRLDGAAQQQVQDLLERAVQALSNDLGLDLGLGLEDSDVEQAAS